MSDELINIHGYELQQTCSACPEQYNVSIDGNCIGYLRLRHGYFYAESPGPGGTRVFESQPRGDGSFEFDEREHHLTLAVHAIHLHLKTLNATINDLDWS